MTSYRRPIPAARDRSRAMGVPDHIITDSAASFVMGSFRRQFASATGRMIERGVR